MNNKEKIINGNDVNGSSARADAVSSGWHRYVRQVPAVRYQATVRTDKQLRIATWNVNTLFQTGKFDNLVKEAMRLNLNILGVSETRWSGIGRCKRECYEFIYSGGEKHEKGVGVLLSSEVANCLTRYVFISDRVLMVKIKAKPVNLVLFKCMHQHKLILMKKLKNFMI